MVSSKHLGASIKKARQEAGLTQDSLSDKAGLAYSTLAKIEQGAIKSPSFFTVYAISEALGLEIRQLLGTGGFDGEKPPREAKKSIKFIYSDMNGVLVGFYHRAFGAIAKETDCNLELVETTFWHYNDAANRGEMTMDEFNEAFANHLGVEKLDWKEHYMRAVKPIKVMQKCLEEIHGEVKIGLLTNTMPGFVAELKNNGIMSDINFDVIIDSSEVGMIKPSSTIYELAEKKSGFSGGEIMFIDDSRTNLTHAEKLGWQVMWFDDYEPEESVRRLKEVISNRR